MFTALKPSPKFPPPHISHWQADTREIPRIADPTKKTGSAEACLLQGSTEKPVAWLDRTILGSNCVDPGKYHKENCKHCTIPRPGTGQERRLPFHLPQSSRERVDRLHSGATEVSHLSSRERTDLGVGSTNPPGPGPGQKIQHVSPQPSGRKARDKMGKVPVMVAVCGRRTYT